MKTNIFLLFLLSFTLAFSQMSSNEKWMNAVNEKSDTFSSLYTKNAMVIISNGFILPNREKIVEELQNNDFKVKQVSTTKRIKANNQYDYEIGSFVSKDNKEMKHLIIWKIEEGKDKRELEFMSEASAVTFNKEDIDKQRENWMLLCNAHDVKKLIEQVYTENTLYYNRGRLLKGRESLVSEYQYMNNPKYTLSLEPILVEPVSNTIVYEFGQCKGSYNGKYILVWKKTKEGIWQIMFDSNI